jgi:hypothetical protein
VPEQGENVLEYRLGQLEGEVGKMRSEMSANHARLELRMEGMQAKFEGLTSVLPERFVTRRDLEDAKHDLEKTNARIKSVEDRAWQVAGALFMALTSLGVAVFAFVEHRP